MVADVLENTICTVFSKVAFSTKSSSSAPVLSVSPSAVPVVFVLVIVIASEVIKFSSS